jgi:hypothetical protein
MRKTRCFSHKNEKKHGLRSGAIGKNYRRLKGIYALHSPTS